MSVIVKVALRVFRAVGVNVSEIVQLAPAATLEPQLFVCAKSPGFVPPIAIAEISNGEPPVFLKVTVCGVLV